MKYHEGGGLKVEIVDGMKLGKRENPEKDTINPDIAHYN